MRNVWNMGASGGRAPSVVPVAKPPSTAQSTANDIGGKLDGSQNSADARANSNGSSLLRPPSAGGNRLNSSGGSNRPPSRSRRSPIPPFEQPSTLAPRAGTAMGGTAPLNLKPRSTTMSGNRPVLKPRTASGSSSLGARTGLAVRTSHESVPLSDNAGFNMEKSRIPQRERTASTLLQPTASSMAKRQYSSRPEFAGRPLPPLPALGENPPRVMSPTNIPQRVNSATSPLLGKVFSKPVSRDTFSSPPGPLQPSAAQNVTSLGSAANVMLDNAGTPKPKSKVPVPVQKPRVSRSRVIAKLGQQRAAAAATTGSHVATVPGPTTSRARSSFGTPARRSLGKNQRGAGGGELVMNAKKKVRQSEYYAARRRSRAAGGSTGIPMKAARKTLDVHNVHV